MSIVERRVTERYQVEGELVRVDPVAREMTLVVKGVPVELDVPLECAILHNGRAMRMRLLQPEDRLCVTVEERETGLVAVTVQVNRVVAVSSRVAHR